MPKHPKSIIITNKILRSFFRFHTPLVTQDYGLWSLNGEYTNYETFDEKGNKYTLWPFPFNDELNEISLKYPIYFSFSIKVKSNDQIDEVNIKIFKEDTIKSKDSNAIPTELLLRVEWSNEQIKGNAKHIHAQPHWHIHSYKFDNFLEKLSLETKREILEYIELDNHSISIPSIMDDSIPEKSTEENEMSNSLVNRKEIHSFKLHLAMLAEWDNQKTSLHNKVLTNEKLECWLPQCLSYIKDQLEYIFEKID